MTIGLDLDGCIADFDTGAITLGNKLFGTSAPLGDPPQWDYFKLWWTPEQQTLLWMAMDDKFWLGLGSYLSSAEWLDLIELTRTHAVYFVTSRTVGASKRWAEEWLRIRGIKVPTVVVTTEKGMAARALDLGVMWDDYPQFLRDVLYYRGWRTRCYLQDHANNRSQDGEWTRVGSLTELLAKEKL